MEFYESIAYEQQANAQSNDYAVLLQRYVDFLEAQKTTLGKQAKEQVLGGHWADSFQSLGRFKATEEIIKGLKSILESRAIR